MTIAAQHRHHHRRAESQNEECSSRAPGTNLIRTAELDAARSGTTAAAPATALAAAATPAVRRHAPPRPPRPRAAAAWPAALAEQHDAVAFAQRRRAGRDDARAFGKTRRDFDLRSDRSCRASTG